MATLNITIDPTQALAGAERIDRALDRIALSAVKASTAISTLERSAFKNLGILNQSFRTSTSQLKEFDQSLTKINPSMNKLSDGFGSVHRSSTLAIGSVTKFFGQMAIGVFLVGELVMIFSALSRMFGDIMTASREADRVFSSTFEQIKSVVASTAYSLENDLINALKNLNSFIVDNKSGIVEFFTIIGKTLAYVGSMAGAAFYTVKGFVEFMNQNWKQSVESMKQAFEAFNFPFMDAYERSQKDITIYGSQGPFYRGRIEDNRDELENKRIESRIKYEQRVLSEFYREREKMDYDSAVKALDKQRDIVEKYVTNKLSIEQWYQDQVSRLHEKYYGAQERREAKAFEDMKKWADKEYMMLADVELKLLKAKEDIRRIVDYIRGSTIDLIDPEKFYKFTNAYKEFAMINQLFKGGIGRDDFISKFTEGMDDALANASDDVKLLVQQIQDLDDAYSKYASITGTMTIDAYNRELEKIKAQVDEMENLGIAAEKVNEILRRRLDIKYLEGQDDLSSGFIAGLLRLKDEIEPWGKTMSDAVVNAAHDMYNAMDDFFFDALEGRMKSFEEYFTGFISSINKITASYLTENLKRGFAGLLPSATVQAGGQQVSGQSMQGAAFSMGNYANQQSSGFWGKPIFSTASGAPTAEGDLPAGGVTWGQGAVSGIAGAAALYSIWQQSQGISKPKAAIGGAVAGAASGAALGYYLSSYSGPYAAIGAAIGAIVGGISGYLSGSDDAPKAKFRLGSGSTVNLSHPNVQTPFGRFGFDQAEVIDTNRFKMVMAQVGEATDAIADVMDSTSIEKITAALAGWRSGSARGDIEAVQFEEQFKNYFAEIGRVWNTSFGDWMMNFNGTLDDLVEGIQKHVAAIKFTQDILDPQNLTEYDQEVNTFNDSVDIMRQNLEETGGSIQELTDLEAARVKGLADLRQVYADSFEMLKMQMGGMSQQNAQMVMWAKKFGTDVPTIISGWEGIEAAIQSMTWEEFEAAVQASGMSISEATQMLLAFDAAAAATYAMIYDINIQSGQMAGMFSDLDLQIMSINQTFENWIFQTKDLANAAEIAAELTVRWGKAMEQASRDAEAAIKSALSNASWMSSNQQKDFYIQSIATTYGIDPNLITPANLKAWISEAAASDYVGWTAQMIQDASALWDTFFPKMEQSTENASNALDDLVQEAQKLANAWRQVIDSIQTDLDQMFFSQDNPQDVLERMQLVRKSLADLGTIDDPEEAEKARGLWKTLLDLGQEAWQRPSIEYQNLFNEVTSALESLREAAVSEEIRLLTLIESNTRVVAYSTSASMSANLTSEGLATSSSGLIGGPTLYVPGFQFGGVQLTPTLANIAEGGPEAIIPLHNGYVPVEIHGESMGDTVFQITIQIDGAAKDPGETRRQARDGVLEAIRSPEVQAELKRQRRWGG